MSWKSLLRNAVVTGAVSAVKNRLVSRSSRSKKNAPMLTPGRMAAAALIAVLSCFGLGHWLNSSPSLDPLNQTAAVDNSGKTQNHHTQAGASGSGWFSGFGSSNTAGQTAQTVSTGATRATTSSAAAQSFAQPTSTQPVGSNRWNQSTAPKLLMGSFNIQVFGRAKIGNSTASDILVETARKFDLLAIQELRSTEQGIMDEFLRLVNADGSQFRYIVGPRQGFTVSKEQYVYLYDSRKLAVASMPFVIPDEEQKFHRPPLVTHFRSIELPPDQAFSFLLLNVHTDPDEIRYELPRLQEMVAWVRANHPAEDDVIVLGDLNAPPSAFASYRWFPQQHAAIADELTTNTRENRNYDNIVFDAQATREFTGLSGVFNFRQHYGISLENALEVSDHFPVWAQFSCAETQTSDLAGGVGTEATR